MKKVLLVVNLAGFLTFLKNDFALFEEMGFDVEVAANGKMSDGTDAVELNDLRERGIKFYQLDLDTKNIFSKTNIKTYFRLKKIINEGGYDLISCHTPIAGFLTRLAAKRTRRETKTKVVYTTHGFTFYKGASVKVWLLYYPIEFIFSAFCDAIVTINKEDFNAARNLLCKQVYRLPGVGVNLNRMRLHNFDRLSYRNLIGVKHDDFVILSVGELSKRKNHQIIIKALSKLPDKDNFLYIICGRDVTGNGYENTLQRIAEKYGIRIKLMGHRLDIPEMNAISDVAALPSIREGLGLAGIESLAAGKPVVGSDVQGIKDYIKNGVNGYLCSPTSAESFAAAIRELHDLDESDKEKMREECYLSAQPFSLERSKKTLQSIYMEILR